MENNHSADNNEIVNFSSPVSEVVTVSVDTINSMNMSYSNNNNNHNLKQYVNDSILSDLKTSPNFKRLNQIQILH